jgi:hypothetical protein
LRVLKIVRFAVSGFVHLLPFLLDRLQTAQLGMLCVEAFDLMLGAPYRERKGMDALVPFRLGGLASGLPSLYGVVAVVGCDSS